jgi:hypothetical protein
MRASTGIGASAVALAVAFNIPYAVLAAIYDYPDILRRPAGEALARFAAGGPTLILTWYAFALAALALAPLAVALSISSDRLARRPALAVGAAIAGALAGAVQAIGLLRWTFVVPGLAQAHADPATAAAAEQAFALANAYGGVAIGEHLGQLLNALFVLQLALIQRGEGARVTAWLGLATAAALAIGTGEGLALALGGDGGAFATAAIAGFLGLTLWLIVTGVNSIRLRRTPAERR